MEMYANKALKNKSAEKPALTCRTGISNLILFVDFPFLIPNKKTSILDKTKETLRQIYNT